MTTTTPLPPVETPTVPLPPVDPPTAPLPERGDDGRPPRRSRFLLVLATPIALYFVVFGAYTLVDLLAFDSTTTPRSFAGVEAVDLQLRGGGARVVADAPGDRTLVERKVRHGLRHPSATETMDGGTLRLHSACPSFGNTTCDVSYVVHVPRGSRVTVSGHSSGSVHLIGLGTPVAVSVTDGSIEVDGARGGVVARSGDGAIHVRRSTGPMELRTRQGGIDVRTSEIERIVAHSGDGGLLVAPTNAPSLIDLSSGEGGLTVELPPDAPAYAIDASTGEGSVDTSTVRQGPSTDHVITLHSGDGGIVVRYGG